jgi:hypothetical protein
MAGTKSIGSGKTNKRVDEIRNEDKRLKGKPAPTLHPSKLPEKVRERTGNKDAAPKPKPKPPSEKK